jgi:hypothetical protein
MVCDRNKLLKIVEPKNFQFVMVADGNKAQINGFGTMKLFSKKLTNILYLPSFSSNLLSLNKLTVDPNFNIIFSLDKVIFQDRISEKKIGEGKLKNGLYCPLN